MVNRRKEFKKIDFTVYLQIPKENKITTDKMRRKLNRTKLVLKLNFAKDSRKITHRRFTYLSLTFYLI